MTNKGHWSLLLIMAGALLVSPLTTNLVAFADDGGNEKEKLTELQKKCQEEPKKPEKIKAECELLNIINELKDDQEAKNDQIDALIAQLQAKDAELMEKDNQLMTADDALAQKDTELMNKDQELMDKDSDLMTDLSDLSGEVLKVCNNIPLFNLVLGTTVTFLDGTSETLLGVKQGLDLVKGVAPSFTVPIQDVSIPWAHTQVGTSTIDPCDTFDRVGDLLGFNPNCEFTYVSGLSFPPTTLTQTIPDPTIDLGAIFGGISDVILPATDGLNEASDALDLVQQCNTDNLPI